jgi:hypothetical protein
MPARFLFPLIALFWIVMNALLWRAEFGGARESGSAVSEEVVWQKILTAPDDSMLEISVQGKKIGYCRWTPNVGAGLAAGNARDAFEPEGMVRRPAGYAIDLEGNLLVGEPAARMRFNAHVRFSTNQVWEELSSKVSIRPGFWAIRTAAAEENLHLEYEGEGEKWSRTFTYEQLRNPRNLIQEFGGPFVLAALGQFAGPDTAQAAAKNLSLGLKWAAWNDSLMIGHSRTRVYRLQARLFDRYQVVVVVSRVGEIMRVELPNGILLVNEALGAL